MARRRDAGQGGITKRKDGRWQGTYTDGLDRKRYVYGRTRRSVQEQLAERLTQVRQGISLEPGRETVANFADRFVRDVKTNANAHNTVLGYTAKLVHLKRRWGSVPLQALTAQQVQQLLTELMDKGLAASTVRGVHTAAHAMLEQAVKWNLVIRNIADAVTPPRAVAFQPKVLAPAEVGQLLEKNHGDRFYPLVALGVTTGLRFGELRALRWANVNLEQAELTVLQSIYSVQGGGWAVKEPKSARGRRTVALGATALSALRVQRQAQRLQKMAAAHKWTEHDLVFTNRKGTPFEQSGVRAAMDGMLTAAKLEHIRFHDLRHTHATILLLAGVPVHVVAARLGDDPATVLRRYAHLLPTSQREAADKFEALVTA